MSKKTVSPLATACVLFATVASADNKCPGTVSTRVDGLIGTYNQPLAVVKSQAIALAGQGLVLTGDPHGFDVIWT